MNRMKKLLAAFITCVCVAPLAHAASGATDALKKITVQDGGRKKPYDTFAREALQLVYGKQTFEGRPAVEIVTTWMLVPQLWETKEFVQIQHGGLKEALRLPKEKKHFAPADLFKNDRLGLVFQELGMKRETKKKLNPYDQAVQNLENQLGTFHAVRNAQAPRIVPPRPGSQPAASPSMGGMVREPDTWKAVADLDGDLRDKFMNVTKAFIAALPPSKDATQVPSPEEVKAATAKLNESVADFMVAARAENPEAYGDPKAIDVEVHYNTFHPFQWTWICYLIAAILLTFAWNTQRKGVYAAAWIATAAAFLLHTYGFGLRIYLTGRPPVSNMYETVVWVAWGAVVFAMIFEYLKRSSYMLLAGTVVSVICLITADVAPAVLDASIHPLVPVLRSTLWLTVHVLTITISYAALFLAWALGLFGLIFIFKGEPTTSARIRDIAQSSYRAIQVGVVLLAGGIILGGVWADYSWGRFWGWDPKETWALIALLGYLALLHARLTNLIQGFGFLIGAVVAASLVVMAWYGVNFVLGAGLHSYGFGAGGVEYVSAVILLQLLFVGYVAYVASRKGLEGKTAKGDSAA